MIREENTKLSLTRQRKLLKISRSSIYYTPVGVIAETLKLMHEPSLDIAAQCTVR